MSKKYKGHAYERSKPHLVLLTSSIPPVKSRSNWRWLPLRNRIHHQPIDFIEVPLKISSYHDIQYVLRQLHPIGGYKSIDKEEALGYILGMVLSDTSKPEGYSNSHQCLVSLTRKYIWNINIGNRFCKYLQALGIYAHKIKDNNKLRKRAPSGEYRWISEKSPFISWLLRTCFGFSRSQRTTFDKIRAHWILHSSYNFRRAFLQGLCDGDGSAHNFWRVEISCDPNQEFVLELLDTFNIKAYIDKDAVCIAHFDSLLACQTLPIFRSALGRLKKLQKINKMIKNKTIIYSNEVKEKILTLKKQSYSGGQISEYLFDSQGIGISPNTINYLYRKNSTTSK
ncbi:hypothetical protein HYT57_00615 [Candidatus Woesearchaeota archaeon]|nr:hypothetical protein [Candidatus Woesearchaeota archaeon]